MKIKIPTLSSSLIIIVILLSLLIAVYHAESRFVPLLIVPMTWLLIRFNNKISITTIIASLCTAAVLYGYFANRDILMLSGSIAITVLLLGIIFNKKTEFKNLAPDSENIYPDIFNTVVDLIVIAEADTRKIFLANKKACQMLGYTEEEIRNIRIDNIHPPESLDFVLQAFQKLAGKETDLVKDIPVKLKDGSVFYADITANPVKIAGKNLLLGVFRDVTERKKAEEDLKQIKFAVDATSDGIGMATAQGHHFYQNEAFNRMFGFTTEEVARRHPIAAYKDKEKGKEVFDTIMSGKSWQGELEMITKDERCIPIFLRADAVKDSNDKVISVIGVHTDITERKKAEADKARLEEMLLHSQKIESIGRLAGGVAHDFNNLLTAILGNTEIAMSLLDPNEKPYQRLTTVKKAAEGAAALTRQLLAFSRKQVIEPKVINLNELIDHISKVIITLTGENISLKINPLKGLYPVKADPVHIEQIIINLAANARDAMPDGGNLILETANVFLDEKYCIKHADVTPGEYVMMAISDTGYGMSKEILSHLYEPFFTTKDKGKGTGLGLATVYGIVKQNGGVIEAYSEVKKGTTFKIYFPRALENTASVQFNKSMETLPTGNETILLVEDNAQVLEFTHDTLVILGYRVLAASSGEEALKIADNYNDVIDLLMTDIILPGMNGRATAEAILARRSSVKILYNSGYTNEAIDKHGILEQGLNFIGKPFTTQELAIKVRVVLDE